MGSTSSKSNLDQRIKEFCIQNHFILPANPIDQQFEQLNTVLEAEYQQIPEKERIGKGRVYISRIAGETWSGFLWVAWTPKLIVIGFLKFCFAGS